MKKCVLISLHQINETISEGEIACHATFDCGWGRWLIGARWSAAVRPHRVRSLYLCCFKVFIQRCPVLEEKEKDNPILYLCLRKNCILYSFHIYLCNPYSSHPKVHGPNIITAEVLYVLRLFLDLRMLQRQSHIRLYVFDQPIKNTTWKKHWATPFNLWFLVFSVPSPQVYKIKHLTVQSALQTFVKDVFSLLKSSLNLNDEFGCSNRMPPLQQIRFWNIFHCQYYTISCKLCYYKL